MSGVLTVIAIVVLIFFGAFKLWQAGEKSDLERCQKSYGVQYTLGHSTTNSSIKWCQSPTGEMRAL